MITLLVLSKYQDIFDQFLSSYNEFGKDDIEHRRLLVTEEVKAPEGWDVAQFTGRFDQSKGMNFALSHATGDVAFFSDDIQFTHIRTIERLHDAAYSRPDVGVVSPKIWGNVSKREQWGSERQEGPLVIATCLCYVSMYFKEQALRESDPFDEQMNGICWEDVDHSLSLGKAGWKSAVTPTVLVKHGFGDRGDAATWKRKTDLMPNGMSHNQHYFGVKWHKKLDFLGPLEADDWINAVLKQIQEGK